MERTEEGTGSPVFGLSSGNARALSAGCPVEAKQRVAAGARCTDEAIRANPYQSLAIAAGVGVVVGVLLGRRNR